MRCANHKLEISNNNTEWVFELCCIRNRSGLDLMMTEHSRSNQKMRATYEWTRRLDFHPLSSSDRQSIFPNCRYCHHHYQNRVGCVTNQTSRSDLKWDWATNLLSNLTNYDVATSSQFGSWGSEVMRDQLLQSSGLTWADMSSDGPQEL